MIDPDLSEAAPMTWIQRVHAQIAAHEGLRLHPYRDAGGTLTIGYGRNLDANGILTTEAEILLTHDIERAIGDLDATWPWWRDLDEVRAAALVDLCFNLGLPRLHTFRRLWDALLRGEWDRAAAELLDSTYAQQVGARAKRLAMMLRTGQW